MAETVGERLKRIRLEHNFTQKQIADYLGFKQGQIAKLERVLGSIPKLIWHSGQMRKTCPWRI